MSQSHHSRGLSQGSLFNHVHNKKAPLPHLPHDHPAQQHFVTAAAPAAPASPLKVSKVAIVGGGVSGLAIAYLLQHTTNQDIHIDLIESQDHVGGRVHTEHFDEEQGQFCELGAMRLPIETQDPVHERVLHMIRGFGLNLIDFVSNSNPQYLNGVLRRADEKNFTCAELLPHADLPEKIKNKTPSEVGEYLSRKEIKILTDAHDIQVGLQNIYKKYPDVDQWSYRDGFRFHMRRHCLNDIVKRHTGKSKKKELTSAEFEKIQNQSHTMKYIQGLVDQIFDLIELTDSATGLLNLSWLESLIDSVTLGTRKNTVQGGMGQIPSSIDKHLKSEHLKRHLNSRAYKIDYHANKSTTLYWKDLTHNTSHHDTYDVVFITAPFPAIRTFEWPAELSFQRRHYIRSLNYDNSYKIYVKFPTEIRTWAEPVVGDLSKGGTLITDLFLRKIVYPYSVESSKVMLASYTWAQDALAWGAYNDAECLKLVVDQINLIHHTNFKPEECKLLRRSWTANPNYVGAFALFSPTQFSALELLFQPELDGRLYFAGEHLSYNHAWIAGALDSAVRVVEDLAKRENWTLDYSNSVILKNPPIPPVTTTN